MQQAESIRKLGLSRVDEIIRFAHGAGYKRIGIANCMRFRREADLVAERLIASGFEVSKVHCKYGLIPASELIDDAHGTICNPAGQAAYLAEQNTEINVVMGLCLGHDMVFAAHSSAPSTTLNIKDRRFGDSPLQGINEALPTP